jgi:hypothetical protein
MVRDERRVAGEEVLADFREEGKDAVEVVVGEEEVGTPALQRRKNERGGEEIVSQEDEAAGLLIDSPSRFWRNHVARINPRFPAVRKSQNHLFALPEPDLVHILNGAAADLEALRGQRLFLTGGTGFFGKWLLGFLCFAEEELGLDLRITVLSRDPAAFARQYPQVDERRMLGFVRGHVSDFSPDDQHFNYVLHAAADTTAVTSETEERERTRTIVGGTRRMLELAQKSGARRLLNVSSGAVYGVFTSQPTGAKEDAYALAHPSILSRRARLRFWGRIFRSMPISPPVIFCAMCGGAVRFSCAAMARRCGRISIRPIWSCGCCAF